MSFRGRGGSPAGGRGGRGGFGGGRGGFGGAGRGSPMGPPDSVVPIGTFVHEVEGEMFVKSTLDQQVPFYCRVFRENKAELGKVDEIMGPINDVYFTVKMNDGVKASSFKAGEQIYADPTSLKSLSIFLPRPTTGEKKPTSRGAGGARGGAAGGRGGSFGGRGGSFGGRGGAAGGRGGSFGGRGGSFGGRGGAAGGRGGSFGGRGGFGSR